MATLEDLKEAIKRQLEADGTISKLRAQLRASVFRTLDDEETTPKPSMPNQTYLLNEMVREYLLYNGYVAAENVLVCESGQPQECLERTFLEREVGLKTEGESTKIPLLHVLLERLLEDQEGRRVDEILRR
eukprot:TRINITY_DN506_c0_g1_i5.p1 TRINITY_DN506_c0_g1~~TRINITY_DN506_c0_g1_i5.p1  ORF type:complete len:131 (+),score=38.39 TRINITY_DN506_c0_g1_i5:378-770(+)